MGLHTWGGQVMMSGQGDNYRRITCHKQGPGTGGGNSVLGTKQAPGSRDKTKVELVALALHIKGHLTLLPTGIDWPLVLNREVGIQEQKT